MISKYILVLLFCCVYGVVSISPFFEKGQRPELYELMDNEMATLRINVPENEYNDFRECMKKKVSKTPVSEDVEKSLDEKLANIMYSIKYNLKYYKVINFGKYFPEYNFVENFPQLQIGEDGYPQYDIEEVFAGYDYNPEHYTEFDNNENDGNLIEMVYKSNKDFDLQDVEEKYMELMSSLTDPNKILEFILDIETPSFESWEFEQINKYVKNPDNNVIDNTVDMGIKADGEIFKTKNATMTFEINGNTSSFDKVTFKVSGALSLSLPKPMFNIKIKNGQELYGRSNFKLRSDVVDATLLRSKLVSDIRNRVGITSISANYVQFYLNDEFMGLYILTDVINLPWIEDVYGDKKSSGLYKCNILQDFVSNYSKGCVNKNDKITDDSEWINFLKSVENAQSASDLENILDIDHLLYEMAIDYLTNAFDHYVHNFYMYRQPNGKWTYISYDFDNDFISLMVTEMSVEKYFNDFMYGNRGRFYDLFISPNPEKFNTIMKDIVSNVVNPVVLFPHIDEIKQFIRPYVKYDKTPNSEGKYPGFINENSAYDNISYEQWDSISEFGSDNSSIFNEIGLKSLILQKYRYICRELNMECDPTYLEDEDNSTTTIDPFIEEEETVYEVDAPTFATDDESSSDEEENGDEFITEATDN